jgi:hypothetical protein
MSHLIDAIKRAYRTLGLADAAAGRRVPPPGAGADRRWAGMAISRATTWSLSAAPLPVDGSEFGAVQVQLT